MRVPSKIKIRYWEKDYNVTLCHFIPKGEIREKTFEYDHGLSKEENVKKVKSIMNDLYPKGKYNMQGRIEIIEEGLYLFKSKEGRYMYKIGEDNHE